MKPAAETYFGRMFSFNIRVAMFVELSPSFLFTTLGYQFPFPVEGTIYPLFVIPATFYHYSYTVTRISHCYRERFVVVWRFRWLMLFLFTSTPFGLVVRACALELAFPSTHLSKLISVLGVFVCVRERCEAQKEILAGRHNVCEW